MVTGADQGAALVQAAPHLVQFGQRANLPRQVVQAHPRGGVPGDRAGPVEREQAQVVVVRGARRKAARPAISVLISKPSAPV